MYRKKCTEETALKKCTEENAYVNQTRISSTPETRRPSLNTAQPSFLQWNNNLRQSGFHRSEKSGRPDSNETSVLKEL